MMRGQCLLASAVGAFTSDAAISRRSDGPPGKWSCLDAGFSKVSAIGRGRGFFVVTKATLGNFGKRVTEAAGSLHAKQTLLREAAGVSGDGCMDKDEERGDVGDLCWRFA
ncbi:hypothetical protein HBI56_175500 [Parastagonospora nodorum]|uniref:Uncharacterized protein n=1 Tax=Phaeosphaeria nodorum (strain SN15 / ATCC MYA-4574 / FGSC 10173) TaxID=321614 RepID=A0A7U2FF01_PHANO|nr:hypothetical protein HBH56_120960 [Parastagonospora nodorum]QRD03928.1 hypothetical protein JI435_442650 [Parastagonospora nodorum SN15]KAH3924275.1 hypothetical protein HBH54_196860 [Parastagonospora nodorum]KAH3968449.1 hypothetical protein HBH52_179320 [Parastagonospora nodorum]KAH4101124.1 hypothetical protein HBH46_142010 [Parastagonospora nodorum]